jgi:Tfp pilus assembly protein PilF
VPTDPPFARRPAGIAIVVLLVAAIAALLIWRQNASALPGPGSAVYEDTTRAFYSGLAALQVGLLENAGNDFTRATMLVPAEPASWANLAISRLRLGDADAAADPIARALSLAPRNADLVLLAARMETARGRLDEAVEQLRAAVKLDPRHLRARFALAEELERTGTDAGDAEALMLLDDLQQQAPGNLAVLLERARVAAKRGDLDRLRDAVSRLEKPAAAWAQPAPEQYEALRRSTENGALPDAARGTAMLRNVLARVPAYTTDLAAVRTPPEIVAEPFEQFIALAAPPSTPAPADLNLAYAAEPVDSQPASAIIAFSLDGTDRPVVFAATQATIRRIDDPARTWPFPGAADPQASDPVTLLPLDWNNDFKTDLLAAGAGGVRLLLQGDGGRFEDATAAASKDAPISCRCLGAWAADIEMDGDLDVVLGVAGGGTVVLRNNGDGTWTTLDTFASLQDTTGFAWADLDRDGDPDAVFLSGGAVRVFLNARAGTFTESPAPPALRDVRGITVADINADGNFDIVAITRTGTIRRASLQTEGWDEEEVATGSAPPGDGAVALLAADLDNNGALDLIGRGTIWLADDHLALQKLPNGAAASIAEIADLDGDGVLDLLGIANGAPARLRGRIDKQYHWKQIRVRAQAAAGDQRINPFAVGGEIEVRSGLLRQKQLLTGGPAHFGLGTRTTIDVARIVWPNGVPQAEFGARADDTIVAEQRLKGSCPWVFAYNGREMRFVTDFLWRSPLGLRINAQDTAGSQTEDWVRIGGDQLAARDGNYDVRITAELWETHFFDHVSLMTIDHRENTEVYVDERFTPAPVTFAVQALRDVRPVARARDHRGQDVTDLVARQDGRFLASFERGRYQGIAGEHFVEFELDHGATAAGERLMLVARGWVYPTDSSINVAVAQGQHTQPQGLSLEYQNERGGWVLADGSLGFPAGKNKTMLIDLGKVPGHRRLRLRTNLEVSWDSLASAIVAPAEIHTTRVAASRAELRYRGFSKTTSPRGEAPETPLYSPVEYAGQRWRDLTGYYTRFGDVLELLAGVDDRYVIMNAGDELAMAFPAPPQPSEGWRRDFVLIGDGWEKDGDFNTEFSTTVLPLPAHGKKPYDAGSPPSRLEDDPVFRKNPGDWEVFHTRHVSPDAFARGLGFK